VTKLGKTWFYINVQGGPGASSCGYGNFELIGPMDINNNKRTTTWVSQNDC